MSPIEQKALRDIVREIRDKARLERSLLASVRRQMDGIALAFQKSFSSSGMMPNLTANRDRMTSLLEAHYHKVGKRFKDTVFAHIGSIPAGAKELRDLALSRWIELRGPQQSSVIITTSQRRMASFVNDANKVLAKEKKPITNTSIASTAANMLRSNGRKRTPSIASFETQISAETTKRITVDAASGRVPFPLIADGDTITPIADPIAIITKRWETEEDDRVRPAHVSANGQIVLIDEPFIVGGQRLNFPGDTLFGASLSNVIGCRCAAVYRRSKS